MRKMGAMGSMVVLGLVLAAITAPGCSRPANQRVEAPAAVPAETDHDHHDPPQVTRAVAVLHPTDGHDVHGVVTFERSGDGVTVTADVRGLAPGSHGFHVHQHGDCSAPDGASAGGHFNPTGHDHGGPGSVVRHVGDLGNIVADAEGNAHLVLTDSHLSLDGSNSIIGRGLIVHASEDDLTSQPTGAAGARVACAVIGVAAE